MATHLAGFTQSVDQATLGAISALQDAVLTMQGTNAYLVPSDRAFIHWATAGGISLTRAQIVTPSIGVKRSSLEIVPRKRGTDETLTLTSPELWSPPRPIALTPTEQLQVFTAEDGAGASRQTAFVCLGPATLPPPPDGDIRRVRFTATTTLTARAWTLCTLIPDVTLEPGTYHLVNAWVFSAGAVAARFAFQGGAYRPGVPAFAGASEGAGFDLDPGLAMRPPFMDYDMGTFTHLSVPQLEMFSISADTAETVIADVVRTGTL